MKIGSTLLVTRRLNNLVRGGIISVARWEFSVSIAVVMYAASEASMLTVWISVEFRRHDYTQNQQ